MGGLSTIMILLVLMGGKVSPGLAQMIISAKRESHKKWMAFLDVLQAAVVDGYFWIRGVAPIQDATGKASISLEAAIEQTKQHQKDDLVYRFVARFVDKIFAAAKEILAPSQAEEIMMQAMLGGGLGGNGGGGFQQQTPPPSTVNVVNQTPPANTAPRTALDVLRTGPRGKAQGVYIDEHGGVSAY